MDASLPAVKKIKINMRQSTVDALDNICYELHTTRTHAMNLSVCYLKERIDMQMSSHDLRFERADGEILTEPYSYGIAGALSSLLLLPSQATMHHLVDIKEKLGISYTKAVRDGVDRLNFYFIQKQNGFSACVYDTKSHKKSILIPIFL